MTETNTTTQNAESKNYPIVSPKVDIMETETQVFLVAEMPGVSEKNVDVDLQGNTLAIRGTTDFKAPEGFDLTGSEYSPNKEYERQFTLGDSIDLNGISANMKDGILKLTLPKVKELSPRKIVVKTE
ncbi:MAG: Hsp20/alpha crystallin family protein [Victivallales bacterium]|nr:Hsp20/alpha crystallin family protein [Victivallales bacterium]